MPEFPKPDKHRFDRSEVPIGVLERQEMVQRIAVFIKHHGFNPEGLVALPEDAEHPERLATGPGLGSRALIEEALSLLEREDRGRVFQGLYPAPKSGYWAQYGIRFGNYLVGVSMWGETTHINMLHIRGQPIYWDRFYWGGQWYYQQNSAQGNGKADRVKGTKLIESLFWKEMSRLCGPAIHVYLRKRLYGFVPLEDE